MLEKNLIGRFEKTKYLQKKKLKSIVHNQEIIKRWCRNCQRTILTQKLKLLDKLK